MNKFFLGAVLALSLLSCDDSKKKELELKEKELELKEREINLKRDSLSRSSAENIKEQKTTEKPEIKKDPALSNINNVLGNWSDEKNENIRMSFNRNGYFTFVDLNNNLGSYEELSGTYKLNNGRLILMYEDRAQQTFNFIKANDGIQSYYIKKSGYFMVKD